MAISFFCPNCKSSFKLTLKACSKCGTPTPTRGRKYRVNVRVHGKQKAKVVDNLETARKIEARLKATAVHEAFDIQEKKAPVTLNKFWAEKYLPWLKENKKSWYVDQCNFDKHLSPTLGKRALDQITQFDIEKFVLALKKKEKKSGALLSAATIRHQLVLLTRIFNIAIQWGVFTGQNPCNRVEKPKLNNTVVAYLSKEEMSNLNETLNTWPDRMQASIVKFAMFTGVRRNEVFKLEWRDVDMERQSMTLRDPKGKKDTTLPLSPQAIDVLETVPREYETPFIFYSVLGKQRKTIRHGWKHIKKAAGVSESFRFHDLRHNYASQLVSNGVSLYAVQALLTHKDAKTTQKYAHLDDSALRQAANLSGDLLTVKPNENNVINIIGGQDDK